MSNLQVATAKVPLQRGDAMDIADRRAGEPSATALIIRADVPLCIVACDVTGIRHDLLDRAARAIETECGIPFDNILIAPTHADEAAPLENLEAAILEAATAANAVFVEQAGSPNSIDAEFGVGLAQKAVADALAQNTPLLAFRRPGGELAALLFSNSRNNTGLCISDDSSSLASQGLEVCLDKLDWGLRGPVAAIKREFEFPTRSKAEEPAVHRGEIVRTCLQVIRIGEVVLAGIPGQMSASLVLELRRRSPFRHTMVVGPADDETGFIPSTDECEPGCHSIMPPGTGEALVDAAVQMLEKLRTDDLAPVPQSNSAPIIRRLTQADALALQTFYNELPNAARRLFRPIGWNASFASMRDICNAADDGSRYDLVLDHGGRIAGWVFLMRMDTDVAHYGIGISEGYTGQGWGKLLTQAVIEHARQIGKEAIDLIRVHDNEPARRLYTSCGFEETGESDGPEGLRYIHMKLMLRKTPEGHA